MDPSQSLAMLQGLGFGVLAIIIVVSLAIATCLMWLSMKVLSVQGRSFWKALGVVVVAGIVGTVINFLLAMVLGGGGLMMVVNIVVNLLVIGAFVSLFCKAPYGRSVGVAALYLVFAILLGIIVGVLAAVFGIAAA